MEFKTAESFYKWLAKSPDACSTSSAPGRFALVFRTQNMKTEAGRRRKIESFVDMLKRGKTIHPQKKVTSPSRGR